jgi:hypothetical protein
MSAAPNEQLPSEFDGALRTVADVEFRSEIHVTDIPAPEGIAPFAKAWSATIDPRSSDGDHGTARLVILYDPAAPASWSGRFRAVCFAKAPLDQSMGEDPFLPKVAWSWLMDALKQRGAEFSRAAGTASTIVSTGFGELESDQVGTEIEMRVSWSPEGQQLAAHVEAWAEFVGMLAGLPPQVEGVTALHPGRNR